MIFLKRRALMTRASFNYKTVNGIGSIVLENCKKSLFKRFEIHGKSTQVTTKGINLIPFKVGEQIVSTNKGAIAVFKKDGINIIINTFSNTTESDLYFFGSGIKNDTSDYSDKLPAGDYTFLSNSKLCNFFVVVWRNGTTKILVEGSSEQITHFTILDGDKVRLMLRPKGNANLKGTEKAQVMLCKHTETNLPYEPYTGGKPSPSLEYTQNTYSSGKIGNKNLFPYSNDFSKYEKYMNSNYFESISYDDRNITAKVLYKWANLMSPVFKLKPNTTYTLSAIIQTDSEVREIGIRVFKNLKIPDVNKQIAVARRSTISNEAQLVKASFVTDYMNEIYIQLDCSYNASVLPITVTFSDIQIEEGKEATEYEHYSDKVFVDAEVTGKNLFDINSFPYKQDDETILINSNQAHNGAILVKGDALRKKQYVISIESFENIGDNTSTVLLETVYKDGVKDERYLTAIPKTGWVLSSTREIDYIWIRNPWKAGSKIKKLQIEEGKEATPYEPYREPQTVRLELNEPLRGIGQYKDVITKDGILRNVLEGNISDNLQNIIYGQPGEKYIFSSLKKADLRYDRTRCMSNVGLTHNQSETRVMYVPVPYQSDFLIKVADDDTVETVREKTKNVTVAYVTKTPIFEPFPQETQLALENLHTNDGTTVITVDSGEVETGIEVEYAVKE